MPTLTMPVDSTYSITIQAPGLVPGHVLVNSFSGVEALSHLFRFELSLSSLTPITHLGEFPGQLASLSFGTESTRRYFHGVISKFEAIGQGPYEFHYRVEVVPSLWLLTHRYANRIFQEKTVPEIIDLVLRRAGFSSHEFTLIMQEKHPRREYCVQYRETDFNFIARLAEEEGIHYFFEHDAHETRLVFSDSRGTYTAIGEQIDLPFVEPSGLQPSCEHVYAFNMSDEVRPGAYVLRDYNFKRPELDLQCAAYAEKHRALEISDYPGEYELRGGGDHVAKIRIEEMECRRRTGHGSANSRRLAPGRYFDLNEHPQPGHDGTYLVTRVIHRGRHLGGRSNHGGGGHLSKVDARVRQVIARAAEHEDEVVRELAGVLSQVIGAGDATDGSRPRTLPRWLVHGGQIAQDAASSYSALGADPLDAASLLRVLGAAGSNGNGHAAGSANQAAYECQFECIPCDITFRPSRVTPWPVMRGCQTATVVGPKDEEIHTDEHGRVKVQFHWDREGQRNEKSSCWIRVSQPWAGVRYGGMAIPRIGQEVIVDFLEGDPDRPIITGRVYNAKTMPPQDLPKDKVRTSIRSQTHKGKGFNEITMDDTTGQEHFYMKSQYDKTEEIGHNRNTSVGLDSTEIVANNVSESVGNNMSTDVTNAYSINCDTMMINAKTSITFQCGASRIHMNQAGFISITGTVITSAATVNNSMVAPMTEVVGAIMLTQAGAVVLIEGGATHVRGEVLAALKGAEVNVVAKADNVIQGGQVKIN